MVSLFAFLYSAVTVAASPREQISFDYGWRFKHGERYPTFKPSASPPVANASSPEVASAFNDSDWELIDVPHDMLIGGTYSSQGDGLEMAHLPRGDGWYRKHFMLPSEWQDQRAVWLSFEGVWQRTSMFLNGLPLLVDRTSSFEPCTVDNPGTATFCANGTAGFYSGHFEGYTGFTLRLDNANDVNFGAQNLLAVHVSAEKGTGWWYEGGGIYRPVNLIAAPLLHIEPDGLFAPARVTGTVLDGGLIAPAVIEASASVRSFNADSMHPSVGRGLRIDERTSQVAVRFVVLAADGSTVANGTGALQPGSRSINTTLSLPRAELWSITRPYLYTVIATVTHDGVDGDTVNVTVGVRSLKWTPNMGFILNDRPTKIRGFCDHNDFGGVGMAVPDRIKLYRAQQLRSVGGNGRRMSHNAPQPSDLDIYDRLGVVVMDENRAFDDAAVDVKHMADLVRRDRNHASVIVWNFCNEGGCQGIKNPECHTFKKDGQPLPHCVCLDINNKTINECAAGGGFRLASYTLDGTRSVIANEEPPLNPFLQPNTDLQGFSHRSGWMFDDFHFNNSGVVIPGLGLPNNSKPLVASECCSCVSVRGEAGKPAGCIKGETNISNGRSFVSGTFSWTLNDYYGEARGIGVSYKGGYGVSSEYGQFDLAGYEKGAAWWYRAWWRDATDAVSTQKTPEPVCRIWGDRWDEELVAPPPQPPRPHGPPPPPPGPGPQVGDVITTHCDSSSVNQHWSVNGSTIKWLGDGKSKCLAYSTKRAAAYGHGQAIVVAPCDEVSVEQQWNVTVGENIRTLAPVACIKYSGDCQCVAIDNGGAAELFHCPGSGQSGAKSDQTFGRICWADRCHVEGIQIFDKDPEGQQTTNCLTVVPSRDSDQQHREPNDLQTAIEVVTALDSVELLRDGVSVGEQATTDLGTTSLKVTFVNGSNLTAVCRNADNKSVAKHTLVSPGAPYALRLTVDAPSVDKGTGSALLLDGHDVALLRVELVDEHDHFVGRNISVVNVSFAVTAGPGRVIASHNGDPSCHTPNLVPWHYTFYGLARGIVQVTHDAASPAAHRRRLHQIDIEGNRLTTIADPSNEAQQAKTMPTEITVVASSPGLVSASVTIPVSTDSASHSVLASATASFGTMQW